MVSYGRNFSLPPDAKKGPTVNANPQAVKFANERVRPLVDQIARVASLVAAFASEFQAKGLGDLIADDATVIDDGSAVDGRTPINGHDVHELLALANDLIGMATGERTRMPTVLKVAVNPGA